MSECGFRMIMDSDKNDDGDTVCETDQGSAGPLPATQRGCRRRCVGGPQVVAEVVPPTHPDAQAEPAGTSRADDGQSEINA